MKSILFPLIAAALITTPVFSKSLKRSPRSAAVSTMITGAGQTTPTARTSYSGPDPYGVYINGEIIGRDPDPKVRQELVYDYVATHRW